MVDAESYTGNTHTIVGKFIVLRAGVYCPVWENFFINNDVHSMIAFMAIIDILQSEIVTPLKSQTTCDTEMKGNIFACRIVGIGKL